MTRTIKESLFDVATAIKAAYPIFATGYHYAKLFDDKGLMVTESKGEMEWVGINDIKGNYFYIRVGSDIGAEKTGGYSDCGGAIQEVYPCYLVAVMTGVDELQVKDALINLLLNAKQRIRRQSIDKVAIMQSELKGLKKEIINAAIARLKDKVLVRIEFDVLRTFQSRKCNDFELCSTC